MKTLGFIGTGNLASFMIEGLAKAGAPYAITVSERSKQASASLRNRYGVNVAASNQNIADVCELIVVSVLPHQASEVLSPLTFRKGQTVLSAMAGVSLEKLETLAAPATCAVSMMPGLANAYNIGPSALYPDVPAARELLAILGPVHCYADQKSYTTASVMGAFSGLTILMMRDAIAWFEANGLSPSDARALVAETLSGNATMIIHSPFDMNRIERGVATPGGITEQGRKSLEEGKNLGEALSAIYHRLET